MAKGVCPCGRLITPKVPFNSKILRGEKAQTNCDELKATLQEVLKGDW